jgi:hypothetical protein
VIDIKTQTTLEGRHYAFFHSFCKFLFSSYSGPNIQRFKVQAKAKGAGHDRCSVMVTSVRISFGILNSRKCSHGCFK